MSQEQGKDLIQSKTSNGAIIALLSFLLGGGTSLDPETANQLLGLLNSIIEHFQGIGVALGTAYAIYGRLVSQHRITSVFGFKLKGDS